jgi:hypothetical protein
MAAGRPKDPEPFVPAEAPRSVKIPLDVHLSWRAIRRSIERGSDADTAIRRALTRCPYLPEDLIMHLVSRISDTATEDLLAVELLQQCHNKSVLPGLLRAWRDRVIHGLPNDEVRRFLEESFLRPEYCERAAESIREFLADDDSQVRVAAIRLIPRLGGLDDIGLLSDLLEFADSSENERESRELIDALSAISQNSP